MPKIVKHENMPDSCFIKVTHVLDEPNFDLSHIIYETTRSQILHLIHNYSSRKIKTTDVKLTINTDRRLASVKKDFDEKQNF